MLATFRNRMCQVFLTTVWWWPKEGTYRLLPSPVMTGSWYSSQRQMLTLDGENCIMRSFMMCIPHQVLYEWPNEGWDGQGMWHTGIWWGNLKEMYHLEDLGIDMCIILKWIWKKGSGRPWVGLIWFRIGANMAMNLQVAQNVGNFLTSWGTVRLTKRDLLHGVNELESVKGLKKVYWKICTGCGQS